jgi:hypothetical protein
MHPTEQLAAQLYTEIVADLFWNSEARIPKPKKLTEIALFSLEAATIFAEASSQYQSQDKPA